MTQHILVLHDYLAGPIEATLGFFKRTVKAITESRMRQAMAAIHNHYMRNKVYRETYNELSRMSDKELDDIGITRGNIQSVAIEAAFGE